MGKTSLSGSSQWALHPEPQLCRKASFLIGPVWVAWASRPQSAISCLSNSQLLSLCYRITDSCIRPAGIICHNSDSCISQFKEKKTPVGAAGSRTAAACALRHALLLWHQGAGYWITPMWVNECVVGVKIADSANCLVCYFNFSNMIIKETRLWAKKIKKITGNGVDPVFWLSPVTMLFLSDPLSVSNSKGRSPAGKSERLCGKGLWICAKSRALAVATGSLPDPETKQAEVGSILTVATTPMLDHPCL